MVLWDAKGKSVACSVHEDEMKDSDSVESGQEPLDVFEEQVKSLARVQNFLRYQRVEAAGIYQQMEKFKAESELGMQYQELLKKKEEEIVQMQMELNSQRKGCDAEIMQMKAMLNAIDKQLVQNKMSLTVFKDWTMELQDRMHAELRVLCDRNVALQVDNNILLQRIEPLRALEKSVLAEEEGEDIQGMLVSESYVEVMKSTMLTIGNQMWKEIRERLESWVTKPFHTLQGAFLSQHESDLLLQVQGLEQQNIQLRQELENMKVVQEQERLSKHADVFNDGKEMFLKKQDQEPEQSAAMDVDALTVLRQMYKKDEEDIPKDQVQALEYVDQLIESEEVKQPEGEVNQEELSTFQSSNNDGAKIDDVLGNKGT